MIARRFQGPPESANGGYACGLLGCRLHGPSLVRLSEPPPLDTPMQVKRPDAAIAELLLEGRTIGHAALAESGWKVPEPVNLKQARAAERRFPWYTGHPYPSCFVCGPDRSASDALRIFPGVVPDREIVAASWTPSESVCDAAALVQPEIVWAALDCPSWFGIYAFEPDARYALLGELTVHMIDRPRQGEQCVVLGWARGRNGRKLYGGTAIFSDAGQLLASSAATWVELRVPGAAS